MRGTLFELQAANAGHAVEAGIEGSDPFHLVMEHHGGMDGVAWR
ncbi:MAG TPA: hypothetical protein VJN43_16705 [Bryobacteraceae bacterium]|nr:hypothetical protein [Bryobacteraceae bacterium]